MKGWFVYHLRFRVRCCGCGACHEISTEIRSNDPISVREFMDRHTLEWTGILGGTHDHRQIHVYHLSEEIA